MVNREAGPEKLNNLKTKELVRQFPKLSKKEIYLKVGKAFCSRCLKFKEFKFFYKSKKTKDGFQCYCISCERLKSKKKYKRFKVKINQKTLAYSNKQPYRYLWVKNVTRHHRQAGYILDFSFKKLKGLTLFFKLCTFCEHKLNWFKSCSRNIRNKPSLENLNLNKILTLKNSTIICYLCNATKSNRTYKQFYKYCSKIVRKEESLIGLKPKLKYLDNIRKTYFYSWAKKSMDDHKYNNKKIYFNFSCRELAYFAANIKTCCFCNLKLDFNPKNNKNRWKSPSLDNKDCKNSIGLTDILILCRKCNLTKSDRLLIEFINYCKIIIKNKNKKRTFYEIEKNNG